MSNAEQWHTDGRAYTNSASVTVAGAATAAISGMATTGERHRSIAALGLRQGREPQHSLVRATLPTSPMTAAPASTLERRSGDRHLSSVLFSGYTCPLTTTTHRHYSTTYSFPSNHESFLEVMARQECQNLPCKEHHHRYLSDDNSSRTQTSSAEHDEDGRNEERRRFFVLLEFGSDNDSSSDSEDDTSTEGEVDDNDFLDRGNIEEDSISDNQGDMNDQRHYRAQGEVHGAHEVESAHSIIHGINIQLQQEISNSAPTLELPSITSMSNMEAICGTNLKYQRIASLLLSLANSEEMPLIRADIPWSLITSCGSMPSVLLALYQQMSDQTGARLLQGVLRSKLSVHHYLLFSLLHHLIVLPFC
jgi:hypothetical protein